MITRADVERAAKLARLRLRDDEVLAITKDLERIVGYVEQLIQVDVEGIEPMTHPVPLECPRRDDEVEPVLGRAAVAQSAGAEDGLVRVPRVIE